MRLLIWLYCLLISPLVALLQRWLVGLRRHYYLHRTPPWHEIGAGGNPLEEDPCEHQITFASRHAIAEAGLRCHLCKEDVADRGDFSGVVRTSLGEAVRCGQCGYLLVASPDTEHGDDLLKGVSWKAPSFVRITKKKALRERWGDDMDLDNKGGMQVRRHKVKDFASEGTPNQAAFQNALKWTDVEPPDDYPSAIHIVDRNALEE